MIIWPAKKNQRRKRSIFSSPLQSWNCEQDHHWLVKFFTSWETAPFGWKNCFLLRTTADEGILGQLTKLAQKKVRLLTIVSILKISVCGSEARGVSNKMRVLRIFFFLFLNLHWQEKIFVELVPWILVIRKFGRALLVLLIHFLLKTVSVLCVSLPVVHKKENP